MYRYKLVLMVVVEMRGSRFAYQSNRRQGTQTASLDTLEHQRSACTSTEPTRATHYGIRRPGPQDLVLLGGCFSIPHPHCAGHEEAVAPRHRLEQGKAADAGRVHNVFSSSLILMKLDFWNHQAEHTADSYVSMQGKLPRPPQHR